MPRVEKVRDWVALFIVMLKLEVAALALLESVTVMVIAEVITWVGVPVIAPVEELSVSPVGSAPEVRLKVFPPEPPDEEIARE